VSVADLARDASVSEDTIRRWVRVYGEAPPPPAILRDAPEAPPDAAADLAAQLGPVADALDAAGGADFAAIVRRAADALRASDAPSDAPDPGEDPRGYVAWIMSRTHRSWEIAERTGNASAAKQYASALERWMKTLKQLEESRGDDAIVIPRSELEERRQRLRETMAALTSEPLRCAECNRRIRTAWAEEADGDHDG
jgi:hypothetical protein